MTRTKPQPDLPAVDVVTACYNGAAHIGPMIASLVAQDFDTWRLFIVDDASTDDTAAIIADWAERDSRITGIYNERNVGSGASRNRALAQGNAPLVAIADADDMCLPARLREQAEALMADETLDAVCSQVAEFGEWGGPCTQQWPTDPSKLAAMLRKGRNPLIHCASMFRRSFLQRVGGYDEECRRAQDLALVLRAGGDVRVAALPQTHVLYRHERPEPYARAIRNGRGRALAIRRNPTGVDALNRTISMVPGLADARTTVSWWAKKRRGLDTRPADPDLVIAKERFEKAGGVQA